MEPRNTRVLLLEDDASARRFVQLALDDMPLELVPCASLAEARQELARSPVQLALIDLTLPDGSGLELIEHLFAIAPNVTCRTVVFSGGVNAALQRQLEERGVWRVLLKPVSVGNLLLCVSDALASLPGREGAEPPIAAGTHADRIAEFFGGNGTLYSAYQRSCMDQFPKDLQEGDRAADLGDAPALRRIAHNLKSALALLGHAQAAQQARNTEDFAAVGALEPMRQGWQQLRALVAGVL